MDEKHNKQIVEPADSLRLARQLLETVDALCDARASFVNELDVYKSSIERAIRYLLEALSGVLSELSTWERGENWLELGPEPLSLTDVWNTLPAFVSAAHMALSQADATIHNVPLTELQVRCTTYMCLLQAV